jgi:hypothetical protein
MTAFRRSKILSPFRLHRHRMSAGLAPGQHRCACRCWIDRRSVRRGNIESAAVTSAPASPDPEGSLSRERVRKPDASDPVVVAGPVGQAHPPAGMTVGTPGGRAVAPLGRGVVGAGGGVRVGRRAEARRGRGRSSDVRERAVEVSVGHGSAAWVGCSVSVSAAVHGSLSKKR